MVRAHDGAVHDVPAHHEGHAGHADEAHHGPHGGHRESDADVAMLHEMAPPGPDASAFERRMFIDMVTMMKDMHAPGYTDDEDVDFLTMMIPHHQGAIDMARLVLVHGDDAHTRALAQGIIASQAAEIEAMRGRLVALQAERDGTAAYPALIGTRGAVTALPRPFSHPSR